MKKSVICAAGAVLAACSFGGLSVRAEALSDGTMTETAVVKSNLAGAPTVVARIEEEKQFPLSPTAGPSNAVLLLDDDCNVVDKSGAEIGTISEVYSDYLAGVAIPIIELESQTAADNFVSLWKSDFSVTDVAVMSADAEILGGVRAELPSIRGIYDCTGKGVFADDAARYEAVETATLAMANVVLLSEAQATAENVTYFQHRFKTVWAELSEENEGDSFAVQNMVSSGAYGIVAKNYKAVYDAYKAYPKKSVARTSVNIAHRGLPMTRAENSLAGAKAAVEAGATHIEIDVQLSKDKQAVVMHDGTIDRTTDGSGTISSMTLEEIRQYHITKTMGKVPVDPEPIPTAEDFFREFDGTGVIIVLEIKTGDSGIFEALRPAVEEYSFWDQLVFISFNQGILAEAHKQMPQVPAASLAGFAQNDFAQNVPKYNAMNAVVDATAGDMTDTDYYDRMMKDRGYMSFFWTYSVAQDCVLAQSKGVYGLTNNAADTFGKERIARVCGKEGQSIERSSLAEGQVRLEIETYAGKRSEVNGRVFSVKDCGEYAEVIAYYTEAEDLLFTRAFRVDYAAEQGGQTGAGGCGSSLALGGGGALLLAGAACLVLKKRKK